MRGNKKIKIIVKEHFLLKKVASVVMMSGKMREKGKSYWEISIILNRKSFTAKHNASGSFLSHQPPGERRELAVSS
jgi:hypothetical protein